ncbi:MAG: hypothetical protein EOM51_11225 [Clostridia bacterium]|nr:hypothetical protein [Clostridia bacterium]
MNKTARCIIKAAQLRAQADKLEKVALLLDDSDEITGLDLGLGAGALGLLGGGAYGINKLMQRRAAAEAAAQAAQAAQAAVAAKAARKSMLLKGALGLGGVTALGGGVYGANKLLNRYGVKDKLKNYFNKGVAGAVPTP